MVAEGVADFRLERRRGWGRRVDASPSRFIGQDASDVRLRLPTCGGTGFLQQFSMALMLNLMGGGGVCCGTGFVGLLGSYLLYHRLLEISQIRVSVLLPPLTLQSP